MPLASSAAVELARRARQMQIAEQDLAAQPLELRLDWFLDLDDEVRLPDRVNVSDAGAGGLVIAIRKSAT